MAAKKQVLDEYEILREKILRGAFHPKQRLVETELAESLNSNRARIRRVLARLEHEGLVAIERYRGARVRMVSEEEAMEIFETRAVLEPYLVRQTVEKATAADKERLTALMTAFGLSLPTAGIRPTTEALVIGVLVGTVVTKSLEQVRCLLG